MKHKQALWGLPLLAGLFVAPAFGATGSHLQLTDHPLALTALAIFVVAYGFVIAEEFIHMRKSKPVIAASGIVWVLVALIAHDLEGGQELLHEAVTHNLTEYAELFLFLLTAMVYINALTERNVFEKLRAVLVNRGFSLRSMFWITGFLAFFISPIADNLTTALLLGAVVLAVGGDNKQFVSLAFINIVVAANAGGAFSPFGDITTLMVWQNGKVQFWEFFRLFLPSLVNFLVPAFLMQLALPAGQPHAGHEHIELKRGARRICVLFLLTIVTAVSFHQFLHLPPFLGMMTGLSYLLILSYYIKVSEHQTGGPAEFNIFNKVARAEWDTLLFFFGVIFCVGGLGTLGYLALASHVMYTGWGATTANIVVGGLSAIVDNIPVMFAILTMNPHMDVQQWLLVTLTAGVGGSLLSVGSAAGVALMGQSRGQYTFFSHLKWSWAIALGYVASIGCHLLLNGK